jgi:thioredoxin reductase (NADPH)
VDDDREVLRAVQRDLRSHYGDQYRIVAADSGASAINVVNQLKERNESVALFLVDQRMPQLDGVGFLQQAMRIFPEAKRVLLTAYADTTAAIDAINKAQIDFYLLKPWDPPEEKLYPVLDDLLDDWRAHYRPPFQGITVIGHQWSPLSHQVKDFLARNQRPYRWFDIERNPNALETLKEAHEGASDLPVVVLPDGTHLHAPTIGELADKVGLQTRAENPFYDLIIVGGGPAGLAAAVYGTSEGLKTLMVEREAPGGQAGQSSRIENYLGFPQGLSGADLARRATDQARRFGAEILAPQEAMKLRAQDTFRYVTLGDGTEVGCNALMIATGVSYRKLDVPGIDELTGAGVYYGAAMTEAIACEDDEVYIVGGANSAGQAAMYFSRYAPRVTMLVRGDSLSKSMSQYLINQIEQTPNIRVLPCRRVVEVHGNGRLEAITIADANTGRLETVNGSALFIFIGGVPRTDWVGDVVARDKQGFILSGPDLPQKDGRPVNWPLDRDPFLLETSVPGIFVAGDVRHGSVKRITSGVGEGAIAIQFVHQYLSTL